jgi:aryl-alcohol dehydrogenase-like predicted oxidoreductase
MEKRMLGRTGRKVSVLSFGCGAVGGLMTKGEAKDQERAFARALECGIDYFDTAPLYGNGASESNVGRILRSLGPSSITLGTKVRLQESDYGRAGAAITASLEASLTRLGRDSVDLFQLHNRIAAESEGDAMAADLVLGDVVPAMQRLVQQGKCRWIGITALGETAALHRVVQSGAFDTAQVCFNALNPSAAAPVPAGYPGQDYAGLMRRAHDAGTGTIGIRLLAAGALSGSTARHPLNMQDVAPIGSGQSFTEDAERARAFGPLLEAGHARSLVELAIRFAISEQTLSTTLVGLATLEQLETAAEAAALGPLPAAALAEMRAIRERFTA